MPSVYIQLELKFPWSEVCLLETYFKTKLAEILLQDNGEPIMLSQIYLNNFDENCPAPKNRTDDVSLLFYVIKPGGDFRDVDVEMTKHAFKILYYLAENKLGEMLGPIFELKIKKVRAKGEDAPPQPTGLTEMERTYIGIGVAVGVLVIIVLISVAVYYIKKITKKNRHPGPNIIGKENRGIEVIESPSLHANEDPPPPSPAETKF